MSTNTFTSIAFFAVISLGSFFTIAVLFIPDKVVSVLSRFNQAKDEAPPTEVTPLTELISAFIRGLPKALAQAITLADEFTMTLARNPVYMWGTLPINIENREEKIPFPILRWWALYTENNRELREEIGKEFLEHSKDKISNALIYTASDFAYEFLDELSEDLKALGTEIAHYNHDDTDDSPYKKIIIFDISMSTGFTSKIALERLPQGHSPDLFLFIFYNDLVPPNDKYVKPWDRKGVNAKVDTLYTISDVIQFWLKNKEMAQALITVKDAFRSPNLEVWNSDEVQEALKITRSALQ
jgi:hypothetical protein